MGALAACSSEPKPVYQDEPEPQSVVTEYDASREPSAAVLALVPEGAQQLSVTDFDQLRLVLGFGTLKTSSPAPERQRFWTLARASAALSTGLLRPVAGRLMSEFRFGQDDVAWEATYTGEASGWIIALHDDVPMANIARAVTAGVGPLKGAVVDADRHLVSSSALPDAADSWGADADLVALTGREAVATHVQRSCLDFDAVFGSGMQAALAAAPAAELRKLDELDAFAVALGTELVTIQLGQDRDDVFERARLAEVMPRLDPEFGLVMTRGVADPSTGRIGYTLSDPALAAQLTRAGKLPFAVCAS